MGQGTPACGGLQPILRIAGTDHLGARQPVNLGSLTNLSTVWVQNPATTTAWVLTDLAPSNLQIGARLVA
jgi:hypothetical protein